jgi:hypothetical protein
LRVTTTPSFKDEEFEAIAMDMAEASFLLRNIALALFEILTSFILQIYQ